MKMSLSNQINYPHSLIKQIINGNVFGAANRQQPIATQFCSVVDLPRFVFPLPHKTAEKRQMITYKSSSSVCRASLPVSSLPLCCKSPSSAAVAFSWHEPKMKIVSSPAGIRRRSELNVNNLRSIHSSQQNGWVHNLLLPMSWTQRRIEIRDEKTRRKVEADRMRWYISYHYICVFVCSPRNNESLTRCLARAQATPASPSHHHHHHRQHQRVKQTERRAMDRDLVAATVSNFYLTSELDTNGLLKHPH